MSTERKAVPLPQAPAPRHGSAPVVAGMPTRAARVWSRVVPALVLLVIGIVFVAQNTQDAEITFLMLSGTVPLSVGLLGALALGAAAVTMLGTIRIHQLRDAVRGARRLPDGWSRTEG